MQEKSGTRTRPDTRAAKSAGSPAEARCQPSKLELT